MYHHFRSTNNMYHALVKTRITRVRIASINTHIICASTQQVVCSWRLFMHPSMCSYKSFLYELLAYESMSTQCRTHSNRVLNIWWNVYALARAKIDWSCTIKKSKLIIKWKIGEKDFIGLSILILIHLWWIIRKNVINGYFKSRRMNL